MEDSVPDLGLPFPALALITLGFGSRVVVAIPRTRGHISVSDTFILLSLLLFGGEAGVLLAGADALFSCARRSRYKLTVAFNTAVYICSTFVTLWALRFMFGPLPALTQQGYTSQYVTAICVMGFVQYAANSGWCARACAPAAATIWRTVARQLPVDLR